MNHNIAGAINNTHTDTHIHDDQHRMTITQ